MTAEQFRPTFTTSQEAAEEAKEERDSYFGNNLSVTQGTRKPSRVKPVRQAVPCPQRLPGDHVYDPALRRPVPNPKPNKNLKK